jgi:hypothetical protein
MTPVFIETFKNHPLPLGLSSRTMHFPDHFASDVAIVGYVDQQSKLVISHKSIITHAFKEVHVKNESKRDDQDIPPFYFAAPHILDPTLSSMSRSKEISYQFSSS